MGTEECSDDHRIPSNALETLRGILISSLSRENLGNLDVQASSRRRKVTFQEFHHVDGECPEIVHILPFFPEAALFMALAVTCVETSPFIFHFP